MERQTERGRERQRDYVLKTNVVFRNRPDPTTVQEFNALFIIQSTFLLLPIRRNLLNIATSSPRHVYTMERSKLLITINSDVNKTGIHEVENQVRNHE